MKNFKNLWMSTSLVLVTLFIISCDKPEEETDLIAFENSNIENESNIQSNSLNDIELESSVDSSLVAYGYFDNLLGEYNVPSRNGYAKQDILQIIDLYNMTEAYPVGYGSKISITAKLILYDALGNQAQAIDMEGICYSAGADGIFYSINGFYVEANGNSLKPNPSVIKTLISMTGYYQNYASTNGSLSTVVARAYDVPQSQLSTEYADSIVQGFTKQ